MRFSYPCEVFPALSHGSVNPPPPSWHQHTHTHTHTHISNVSVIPPPPVSNVQENHWCAGVVSERKHKYGIQSKFALYKSNLRSYLRSPVFVLWRYRDPLANASQAFLWHSARGYFALKPIENRTKWLRICVNDLVQETSEISAMLLVLDNICFVSVWYLLVLWQYITLNNRTVHESDSGANASKRPYTE